VITFGCRVNQADSLGFEEDFLARGASAAAPEDSDVVVVNTCSVTASADQAARQTIRRVARLNPDVKIIVTGCYATVGRTKSRLFQTSCAWFQTTGNLNCCRSSVPNSRPPIASETATAVAGR
jgi:tRNA A37 methylthiotransferase MiaB